MTSTVGTDRKQYHDLLFNVFSIQLLPIRCPIAGTTSHLAELPGDHLHLEHYVDESIHHVHNNGYILLYYQQILV